MTFTVPASVADQPENRFTFKVPGTRRTFSVAHLPFLSGESGDLIEHSRETPVSEATLTRRLLAVEAPDAAEHVAKLRDDQVIALSVAWAAAHVPAVDADA